LIERACRKAIAAFEHFNECPFEDYRVFSNAPGSPLRRSPTPLPKPSYDAASSRMYVVKTAVPSEWELLNEMSKRLKEMGPGAVLSLPGGHRDS